MQDLNTMRAAALRHHNDAMIDLGNDISLAINTTA